MRRLILASVVLAACLAELPMTGCASCARQTARSNQPVATQTPTTTPPPPKPKPVLWPLLGTPAPSASAIKVRVISVKVENEKPARPQSNLAAADVVYETVIEGGDTRYNALYHSKAPTKVGPVRSARVSDTFIVPEYRALFSRIGGDYVTETEIKRTPNMDDINGFKYPGPYTRSSARRAPHNLYVSLPAIRRTATRAGFPAALDAPSLEFGDAPSGAGTSAVDIRIPMSTVAHVSWAWQRSGRYLRTFNGSRLGDAGTSRPYEAANVVVMFVQTIPTKALDPAGNVTDAEILGGTGRAVVFRNGMRYDGTWNTPTKKGAAGPPRLKLRDGTPIPLSTGKTWFELIPTTGSVSSR